MLPSAESIQIILPSACFILLVLAIKRPAYGVVAYFIVLNAKLGDMYPALGAMRFELVVAIYVLIVIFIAYKGFWHVMPRVNPINKAFWILFFVGMLSVLFSVDTHVSWENGGYFLLKSALFYIMVVMTINEKYDLQVYCWAFALVGAWIAYEPVANYISGNIVEYGYGSVAYGRFGAASGHVALANTLNQTIPLTYFLAVSTKDRKSRFLLYAIVLLCALGIYATKSRGGFLGLVLIGLGLIYLSQNRSKGIMIAVVVSFIFLTVAGTGYMARMDTISHGISGGKSSSDRYLGFVHGISMMIKRPILGVGIGCYAEARSRYFSYYFYAHNLYGELLGELGLASIAWFYWMYLVLKRSSAIKKGLDPPGNVMHQKLTYIINGIQLGVVLRLFLGNFSHSSLIWFWFMMAAFIVGIENIWKIDKDESMKRVQGTTQ